MEGSSLSNSRSSLNSTSTHNGTFAMTEPINSLTHKLLLNSAINVAWIGGSMDPNMGMNMAKPKMTILSKIKIQHKLCKENITSELADIVVETFDESGSSFGKRGRIFLTNYRLGFEFDDDDVEGQIVIPLGSISKFEHSSSKSDQNHGSEVNSFKLKVSCKNFRIFKFRSAKSWKPFYRACKNVAFFSSDQISISNVDFDEKDEGWNVYDTEKEYSRMKMSRDYWEISDINREYGLCETYPKKIVVPKGFKDLNEVVKFRTKQRLPVLSWIHAQTQVALCRSSQPMSKFTKTSSIDEDYIEALKKSGVNPKLVVYDARPKLNVQANKLTGGGTETVENYGVECRLCDIANIHVMRSSLKNLKKEIKRWRRNSTKEINHEKIGGNTQWLTHLKFIIDSAVGVAASIINDKTSVLVHCSDGWDRTPQIVALSMLIMDGYYRTSKGFQVLVEKEWCSFGHKFQDRIGHGLNKKKSSVEETSPVFLQFIDCVWQLLIEKPQCFEFDEEYLITILEHLYSCRFGTFLENCEKARHAKHKDTTHSLWSHISLPEVKLPDRTHLECPYPDFTKLKELKLKIWESYYFKQKLIEPPYMTKNK